MHRRNQTVGWGAVHRSSRLSRWLIGAAILLLVAAGTFLLPPQSANSGAEVGVIIERVSEEGPRFESALN